MTNRITTLFEIQYPIIQAGMIWCSGWRLASAVSNAGGLGIIGAGSMHPEVLQEHIRKCKGATDKPFAVNIPLLYPEMDKMMELLVAEGVKIVFTSAGNPKIWTGFLKEHGITVVHVVSSTKFALKAEEAGCDAVVAEGFEAGGHNGREETTTMCLIPAVAEAVSIPVIAAGGIGSGKSMLAAFALGAEGVQVGSRFAASEESSAHQNFKNRIVDTPEGGTLLSLKQLTPVRLIRNEFQQQVMVAEVNGADKEALAELLGKRRAKKGMFEGDMAEGELEIGQVAATIKDIKPAAIILQDMWNEFVEEKARLANL
ncbi:nitronate monooxygenase [Limibacter armeniacum]|uniref:NAD(P)H-dependent flavin oxidoreductase n=1 Tax=Limibacter armeniacum TaxID=466084 RepID=UPI002FE5F513